MATTGSLKALFESRPSSDVKSLPSGPTTVSVATPSFFKVEGQSLRISDSARANRSDVLDETVEDEEEEEEEEEDDDDDVLSLSSDDDQPQESTRRTTTSARR